MKQVFLLLSIAMCSLVLYAIEKQNIILPLPSLKPFMDQKINEQIYTLKYHLSEDIKNKILYTKMCSEGQEVLQVNYNSSVKTSWVIKDNGTFDHPIQQGGKFFKYPNNVSHFSTALENNKLRLDCFVLNLPKFSFCDGPNFYDIECVIHKQENDSVLQILKKLQKQAISGSFFSATSLFYSITSLYDHLICNEKAGGLALSLGYNNILLATKESKNINVFDDKIQKTSRPNYLRFFKFPLPEVQKEGSSGELSKDNMIPNIISMQTIPFLKECAFLTDTSAIACSQNKELFIIDLQSNTIRLLKQTMKNSQGTVLNIANVAVNPCNPHQIIFNDTDYNCYYINIASPFFKFTKIHQFQKPPQNSYNHHLRFYEDNIYFKYELDEKMHFNFLKFYNFVVKHKRSKKIQNN